MSQSARCPQPPHQGQTCSLTHSPYFVHSPSTVAGTGPHGPLSPEGAGGAAPRATGPAPAPAPHRAASPSAASTAPAPTRPGSRDRPPLHRQPAHTPTAAVRTPPSAGTDPHPTALLPLESGAAPPRAGSQRVTIGRDLQGPPPLPAPPATPQPPPSFSTARTSSSLPLKPRQDSHPSPFSDILTRLPDRFSTAKRPTPSTWRRPQPPSPPRAPKRPRGAGSAGKWSPCLARCRTMASVKKLQTSEAPAAKGRQPMARRRRGQWPRPGRREG